MCPSDYSEQECEVHCSSVSLPVWATEEEYSTGVEQVDRFLAVVFQQIAKGKMRGCTWKTRADSRATASSGLSSVRTPAKIISVASSSSPELISQATRPCNTSPVL